MAQPPASSRRPVLALPPEPTPFIGRSEDVARIVARLERARLVTVCGPPGIGKTRTALRIATERITEIRLLDEAPPYVPVFFIRCPEHYRVEVSG